MFTTCTGLTKHRPTRVAFRALAQSRDLLGVPQTNGKSNRFVCVVDFCATAQFYIVPRTGVFTTYTGLNTGLQRGHPTAIPP